VCEIIDWSRTRAYATPWGLNVNLRSREPNGTVAPGREYEETVDALVAALQDVRVPGTGDRLFDVVARRGEVYAGPFVDEAHDVMLAADTHPTEVHVDPLRPAALRAVTTDDLGNGYHRREGMLIMRGPQVLENEIVTGARIEDLAPTVLHLLGLPVPEYMDGRVLTSALRPEARARAAVARVACSPERNVAAADAAAAADALIRRQLRALGYLG